MYSDPNGPCGAPNRTVTAFLYLNDVETGGNTVFNNLGGEKFDKRLELFDSLDALRGRERVQLPPRTAAARESLSIAPREGMLVIHFPSSTREYMCVTDPTTRHESEDAVQPKYIVQQFISSAPVPLDKVMMGLLNKITNTGKALPKGLPPGM